MAAVLSIPAERRPEVIEGLSERAFSQRAAAAALTVFAPWTGEPLGTVPRLTPADVAAALRRARTAQPYWAAMPYGDRAAVLLRFHDLLLQRQDEILDLMQLESGKCRRHALEEVLDAAIIARHYAYHGERYLRPQRRKGAIPLLTDTWVYHPPRGVVGVIAPWNYPLSMSATDAIPALLAGNTVVLKPDSQTPFTALWVAELLVEAGLPAPVFQVVTGSGSELGPALLDGVDFITFTGSTATGRIIASQAGERLIGTALELGGKNPMLVLDDASLEMAVQGAILGCFASAGQLCVSIERIYVHRKLYAPFLERLAARVRMLRLGTGFSYDVEMGSLVSAAQLATVQRHVDDAVAKGATLLAGGRPRPDLGPYFFEPTLLTGVTREMEIFDNETFGPVVSIYMVDSDEEAIRLANDSTYGLNASIWTRNHARGSAIAQRIEAGTVSINEAYAAAWGSVDAPMGGFKASGVGRRHGGEGIRKYTNPQTVALQHLHPISAPRGVPSALFARIMLAYLRVIRHIPGIR